MIEEQLDANPTADEAHLFVVVASTTHTAVLRRVLPAGMTAAPEHCAAWEAGVLEVARDQFTVAGLDAPALKIVGIHLEDEYLDAFDQLGVPDEALIRAGRQLYSNNDLTVDGNAEISGLNIQAWQYMAPGAVLDFLASAGPIPNSREQLALSDQVLQDHPGWSPALMERVTVALKAASDALDRLVENEDYDKVIEETGCVARVSGALADIQSATTGAASPSLQALQRTISTALPAGDGDYDDGYRDSLQSTLLALNHAGVPDRVLSEAVFTALDAHGNNAPEAARPTVAEPLTIAYVAMGAMTAIQKLPGGALPTEISDRYGGQLGFVDAVISQAWRLDAEASARQARGEELDGVFVYEVAEPFGERFAVALLRDAGASPDVHVSELFSEMNRSPEGMKP